jgi:hypothetical protein
VCLCVISVLFIVQNEHLKLLALLSDTLLSALTNLVQPDVRAKDESVSKGTFTLSLILLYNRHVW